MGTLWLPQAHFGYVGAPVLAPAADPEPDPDPDDELLPETPPDLIAMLGFDPRLEADAWESSRRSDALFLQSIYPLRQA